MSNFVKQSYGQSKKNMNFPHLFKENFVVNFVGKRVENLLPSVVLKRGLNFSFGKKRIECNEIRRKNEEIILFPSNFLEKAKDA